MKNTPRLLIALALSIGAALSASARDTMRSLEELANAEPKPFAVVGSTLGKEVDKGQGVFVTTNGYLITVGHITWHEPQKKYADKFTVYLRTIGKDVPEGYTHEHITRFTDKEDFKFREFSYPAELVKYHGSRFIENRDLCVLKTKAPGPFPKLDFYSKERPHIKIGEKLYLCHYIWPTRGAEPTFIINPITVVGVVQTSSGFQVLADGYTRYGSSGGAILKDGKLIGIQSAAYTINAKDIGEVPSGMLSFQLVWRNMFNYAIK